MVLRNSAAEFSGRLSLFPWPKAVAFMASCVERRRPAVRVLNADGRRRDVEVFDAMLDALWLVASGEAGSRERRWDDLDSFSELASDDEADGQGAFAEDAIVALWYASQFLRTSDSQYLMHCATRCVDSACFLQEIPGSPADAGDAEVRIRTEDLEDLENSGELAEGVLQRLRSRSVREAARSFPM
jgi:hypothetical protein